MKSSTALKLAIAVGAFFLLFVNLKYIHFKLECTKLLQYENSLKYHDHRLMTLKGKEFHTRHLKAISNNRVEICTEMYAYSGVFKHFVFTPFGDRWK